MRSVGDRIVGLDDEEIIIGAEIPPINVMTIEVRYGEYDQALHNARYQGLIQNLSPSGEDDDGTIDLDKTARRQNILGDAQRKFGRMEDDTELLESPDAAALTIRPTLRRNGFRRLWIVRKLALSLIQALVILNQETDSM